MNKKILIGSIISVVILVLVSFTSVIGYNSVESNVKASPLFKVRTKRAIGEESKVLTRTYVGKGNTLPFPERDEKAVMVQKVIDSISKMDEEKFDRYIAYIINYAQKDNRLNGVNPDRIREALNLLRYSNESILIYQTMVINYPMAFSTSPDTCDGCITFNNIGGILICILLLPLLPFIIIKAFIDWCFEDLFATLAPLCIGVTIACPITLRKLS